MEYFRCGHTDQEQTISLTTGQEEEHYLIGELYYFFVLYCTKLYRANVILTESVPTSMYYALIITLIVLIIKCTCSGLWNLNTKIKVVQWD